MTDTIKHPKHYTWHPEGECIKIVQEFPYNVGVAIAYCWRHGHKGNPVGDLEKAIQHLQFEVKRLRRIEGREPVNGLREVSIAAWNTAETRPTHDETRPTHDTGCVS